MSAGRSVALPRVLVSGFLAGGVVAGMFGLLEWLVLLAKLPVSWSGSLILLIVRNVLMYAAIGAVAGAALGLFLILLALVLRTRVALFLDPPAIWCILLSGAVAFYWVNAINVLYRGGYFDTTALVLDATALILGAVLAFVLVRRTRRYGGWRAASKATVLSVLLLWLPFFVVAGGRAVDHIEGGVDLGRVRRNVAVAKDGRPPNIVMLMLDTTRIDCLGCYGSTNGVTPRIDELATESVVFEQAVTPEPLTRPAVSTMLTGLYPRTHGVDTNRKKLADQFTTLPEVLSDNGYVTGGFMSAAVLSSFYGTGQGFDTYVGPAEGTWELSRMTAVAKLYYSAVNRSARLFEMPGGKTVERAATWIGNNRQRPFFAFVHLFDPHFPYDPPPEHDLAAREGFTGIRAPYSDPLVRFEPGFEMPDDYLEMMWLKYRGEVSYTDECVGRMLDALDSMGLADDTIVVLVSDHGESFEKGFYFAHGTRLFDSLVRVALMVRYPGLEEPHRVSGQVLLTDLYPSLLAMLNLPVEDDIQGRDIFTTRGGADADSVRPVFLQTDFENAEPNRARMSLGVRTPEWKYVVSPELDLTELYDLVNDPTEVVNLVDTRPEMRGRFAGLLSDWTVETEQNVRPVEELSPERLEALRALGYVQ